MIAALGLALVLGSPLQEPVKVSATLSSARVRVGETAVLQVNIETQGDVPSHIALPDLPAPLTIASTQDFSQLQISYPGGRSRVIRRDVVLAPTAAGQYLIGAVEVTVDGRTYRTRPLTLLVLPERPGERTTPTAGEVRLRAWLEPDTAYVGEQVLLHAEALFPQDLRLRQSRPASYDVPTPPDFWVQDVPEPLTTGLRSIDGEVFETQTFRRAYFALEPGTFRLPPARLLYEVRRGFLYAPESRELSSDSLNIVVLPLPEAGRPASFTGAVGRLEMRARLEPASVPAGDAATLTVEVRGAGNVKALPAPILPELPNVEVFPPTEDSRPETVDHEIRGMKRFTWVLIPEHAGTVRLPALEYGYFDPVERAYRVLTAEPLALAVTPAAAGPTGGREALRDIVAAPGTDRLRWVRSGGFAAAQVLPLLAILAALVIRRRTGQRQPSRRRRRAERSARLAELSAAVALEADRSFFADVSAFVRGQSAEALDRPELRTCPLPVFRRGLEDAGVGAGTRADFSELMARLDHARFAPVAPTASERRALLDEAEAILQAIERESRSARRRGFAAAGAASLALLLCAGVAEARQDEFALGVAAYRDGRFRDAATSFARYADANPRDPHAWYNLGNAEYATGDRGTAVLSWLRAVRVRPRFSAARNNLAAVGADDTLRWLPPPFALALHEALLALALCWWLAAAALTVAIVRRNSRWYIAAGLALVPAIMAAAATLPASLKQPAAVTLDAATPLLAGPAHRSEEIRQLPQANLLGVLETRGDWLRVRTADNVEGWVDAARVGTL